MLTTTLEKIITPPPVPAPPPVASTATAVTSQALSASLYLSVPSSASPSVTNTRMRCITPHPSLPQIAYVLDLPDQKLSPQRQLIVQNTKSRQVLWKCSMGDLAAMLFEFDVNSTNGISKQMAALRSLGPVQGLAFFDTATLQASGMEYLFPKGTRPFQYIMVQFSQRIVILNLRVGPNSFAATTEQRLSQPQSPFHPVLAHILETQVKATPTTMPIPLTSTLLMIGCADGALRVYDFKLDKILKSVRGPSGKDAIWQLLAANSYNNHDSTEKEEKQVKRVLAIGMKGAAYIWEIVLQKSTLIDIRPPVVRMDGTPTLTTPEDSSDMELTYVDYDAHRNYFLWFVPQKHHVLMWDLSRIHELKRKKNVTPKQEARICSLSAIEGPLAVVAGWLHPAFPASALTCAVVTQGGELHIVCISIAESKPGRTVKAIPFYTDNLSSLIQRDAGTLVCPRVRIQALTTFRRLDTASVLVGSNLGLLNVCVHEAVPAAGARHAHFGAGIPEWGKSVLTVDHSTLVWAQLDIPEMDPCGTVSMRNSATLVYKSPTALHLPTEIQKRAVRLPPRFLPSPSGNFLCLFWQDESRYEILHLPSILRRNDGSYSPAVSSGSNVVSFAWVGDDDVFALLHPAVEARNDGVPSGTDSTWSATTASTKDSSSAPSVGKQSVSRALRKPSIFKNERSKKPLTSTSIASSIATTPKEEYVNDSSRNSPHVELKVLVPVNANAAEISGSIAAATATTLGDITLRGGNRSQPTTLFGGPVLCVASKNTKDDVSDGGSAYFYTRKAGSDDTRASAYISSGPTLPFPSFVEWDDDGRLCALVVQSRVAIYLSEAPEFVLLGNVQLGSPSEVDVTVTGLKFIHGVLYCTTRTSVQCIFLGDLEEGICHLDSFLLASAEGPSLPQKSFTWSPSTIPMTLNHPIVLGYQSGSLLLSTVNGLQAVPLSHPLLRIGTLLGAGQPSRAERWFAMVAESDHEALATFVERRGAPDLAIQLSGLSLEYSIDLCLRYGFTERLEELIDTYGLETIRKIDHGRGLASGMMGQEEHGHSIVVCVGAYLLSQGKAELVRRIATECLRSGEEGKREAFVLASLLLAVDQADARRLVKRAVSGTKSGHDDSGDELEMYARNDESAVVSLVRNHML